MKLSVNNFIRLPLCTLMVLQFYGCERPTRATAISLKIPNKYEGPILVSNTGSVLHLKELLILPWDHSEIRQPQINRAIEFTQGDIVYLERPHSNLFADGKLADEFGVWGKRYVKLAEVPTALKERLSELKCGNEFFLFFIGRSNKAKEFFEGDSEALLKRFESPKVDKN